MTELAATDDTLTLLWEACRRQPDVEAVRSAADGDVQPELLSGLAFVNRLGPLLWRALRAAGREEVLGQWSADFERMSDLFSMQALLLYPEVVARAVGPLAAAGLQPMILKGPLVAQRYPDAGLRPMDDLDLLLPPEEHDDGIGVLEAAGWTVSRRRRHEHYDTQLRHPEVPSLPLELHFGLEAWHERSNNLDPMWLWRQRVQVNCMGTETAGLPPEVELVYLAAHAGKPYHGFDRLIWLCDLVMVAAHAEEHGGLSWERVRQVSQDADCVTVVSAALQMATRMGLELPDGSFRLPSDGWRGATLQRLLELDWPVAVATADSTYHIRFALVDSVWRRLALLGASPYRESWPDRLRWPVRVASRSLDLLRHSHAAPS
jgi:hypothetical protein